MWFPPCDADLDLKFAKSSEWHCLYIALKVQDHNNPSYILVPTNIASRISRAYRELGYEEPQPIIKTRLHIYRINENLMIEIAQVGGDSRGGGWRSWAGSWGGC